MDKDATLKHIKGGWIAALISAAMTGIVVTVAIASQASGTFAGFADPWNYIDVVLILGLAFGIYKKSRIAATIMFIYFVGSKIYIMIETGAPNGLILGVIFCYFYFMAMIATYKYHRNKQPLNVAEQFE